ncbi:MAG: CCA tRNA nucleotidyltransferase [Akkermansiaceae bacterium]|nr:CCA tRNA nucleotidyltransferase [Akkermansiaceae bacterium]
MPFPSDFENNICARARIWFGSPVHTLRQAAERVARRLVNAGHEAFFAGGCVRDALRGREPEDYDIATSARPDEVLSLFPGGDEVGAHFGVILVRDSGHQFEVATFRSDGPYLDGRHPESVTFTTAEEDARRRDFTINGLFENPATGEVLDFVGGRADLEARLIRAIGEPRQRFEEDSLRLLRAVRFAVTTGFEIDRDTWKAVRADAPLLARVSPERIRGEFDKIILHSGRRRGFELLVGSGLMQFIIPEFLPLRGCKQPPQFHPEGDVYTHTLIALDLLPENPSLELALAVVLHDIAKPPTLTIDEASGRIRNNGHDRLGARMSEEILRRLRYSNHLIEDVSAMVANHMNFMHVQHMRTARLKRFMARPTFADEVELHRVDCASSHGMLDNIEYLEAKAEEFAAEPLIPPPLVSGHDLIAMGLEPGPRFGEILEFIQTEQLEGRLADRVAALALVREKFAPE